MRVEHKPLTRSGKTLVKFSNMECAEPYKVITTMDVVLKPTIPLVMVMNASDCVGRTLHFKIIRFWTDFIQSVDPIQACNHDHHLSQTPFMRLFVD